MTFAMSGDIRCMDQIMCIVCMCMCVRVYVYVKMCMCMCMQMCICMYVMQCNVKERNGM